jgi:hypothetical protein
MYRKPFYVTLFVKQDRFYSARRGWHYDDEEQVWPKRYGRRAMALPSGPIVDFYYRNCGRMRGPAFGSDKGTPCSG